MGQDGEVGAVIHLYPVMSGSKENEKFYRYSPSGKMELGTLNPKAAKFFEIGKEYYIDFSEAVSESADDGDVSE